MIYSETSFFDGQHAQHCADRDEHNRLARARRLSVEARRYQVNRAWEAERAAMNGVRKEMRA